MKRCLSLFSLLLCCYISSCAGTFKAVQTNNVQPEIRHSEANEALLAHKVPEVIIQYAAIYDDVCSKKYSYPIEPAWKQELIRHLPQWRKLWNEEGSLLLKTSMRLTGKPFLEQNFKVALSLCSFPSISFPLIVNARFALQSFTANPISDSVFISVIEHEILHSYLESFLPKTASLLTKYKAESPGVLGHIHLLALQKATYLELGWQNKLNDIIAKDETLPNKDYKRAWEIIAGEGHLSFINELKSAN